MGTHFADAVFTFTGPALAALNEAKACAGRLCFVAGTLVWVAWQDGTGQWHTGTKPVEQVKAGEYVIARNEQAGRTEYKKVLRTTIKQADVVVAVPLADAKTGEAKETITASREHPFYVDGKGFVPAGALAIGNSIVTRAGPVLVVKSVEWKRQTEGFSVYNFAVDDLHTYFVGNTLGGAWVHNAGTDPWKIQFSRQVRPGETFSHGDWEGRSVEEAIAAAKRLGKLPPGLHLQADWQVNGDGEFLVAANNRTLYVAQEANVPVNPETGEAASRQVQKQFQLARKKGGSGLPIPRECP